MAVRFQIRGGTSTEWTNANPILMTRELGVETDTQKIKIGDGATAWNALSYMTQGEKGLTGDTGEDGLDGKSLEFNWNGTSLGIRVEGQLTYTYVDLKGDAGNDLEFEWDGTSLGVREKGTSTYSYVDLKGETGSIDNLDKALIDEALGFTTKDLGNVDNLKQMPISNGTLEDYTEKLNTTTGTINLSLGNVFTDTPTADRTYSITNAKSGVAHSFTLIITMGATVRTLTFPASVTWQDGEMPDMTEPNKTYVLTFVTTDSGTTWLGMFGGMFNVS